MWSIHQTLAFSIKLGLRKGLRRVRMRRALSLGEEDRVANEIVDHLILSNWKFEEGPPVEGHGSNIMPPKES